MSHQQYDQYLLGMMVVALIGSIFNIGKYKTRGVSALFLSGAMVAFALACYLMRAGSNLIFVTICGALVFMLITLDAIFRLSKAGQGKKR